ncbi:MAG: hypothetical protein HZB55_06725 [Deltaproteobacteria bacterium]|nr:hypothetical protein [Deltaproteobacteria bacterium]
MIPRLAPLAAVLVLLAAVLGPSRADADDVPRMTAEELRAQLGGPGLSVLDVRTGPDWLTSREKIRGAVREDPNAVAVWADQYPKNGLLVLYCA